MTSPESVGAKVLMQLGVDGVAVRAEEAFGPGALERPVGKRVGGLFRRAASHDEVRTGVLDELGRAA